MHEKGVCIMSSVTDLRIFDFDPWFQGHILILRFCCNLHMICNYCSKKEYAMSKNERGVHVLSHSQVLSISDLDLWLPDHISDVKPLFYSTRYEQSLCTLEAMMYLKSPMHVNPMWINWKSKQSLVLWADNSLNNHHGNNILHNFKITILYAMLPLNIYWIASSMKRCCGFL